jgi:CRP-like cAMP-binding protein
LLRVLPDEAWNRLSADFEPVQLEAGAVLHESAAVRGHVYFPTTAVVSLLYALKDGRSAALALVGFEGVVGISAFMGGGSAPSRAVVQGAGLAFRMRAEVLNAEFERAGPAMHLLLRYTQALITQMAQTAVCIRHHSVEQQLCRWLLLSLDRLPGQGLAMTQEAIAHTLGVRREGVSVAAGRLQEAGIISYRRGHIEVLRRSALEAMVCECYGVVRRETERLLPSLRPVVPSVRRELDTTGSTPP